MRALPSLLLAASLCTALPASASTLRLSCRWCGAADATPLPPPPPPPNIDEAIPPPPGEITAAANAREQQLQAELAEVIRRLEALGMNMPAGATLLAGVAGISLYFSLAATLAGLLVALFGGGPGLAIVGGLVMVGSIVVLVLVGSTESSRRAERLQLGEERHRLQRELKQMHGGANQLPWTHAAPLLSLAF